MSDSFSSFSRFSRTFNAGEIIFSEFEPGNKFYLIQSGRVEIIKNAGEFERTLDILLPPEMFGEMAILENSPRTATAIALDKVTVLEFNAQNFDILLRGNPQIALKLLKTFSRRIYDSKRRFMILTLSDPNVKIADVFLMLEETQTDIIKDDERREFMVKIEDIAHWAGMSFTQTRDIINRFITKNRMELYNDRIVVKNISDLRRFVNSQRNQG